MHVFITNGTSTISLIGGELSQFAELIYLAMEWYILSANIQNFFWIFPGMQN